MGDKHKRPEPAPEGVNKATQDNVDPNDGGGNIGL
jgi:hypothetical protein